MTRRGPTELAGAPSSAPRRVCPLCDVLLSLDICPHDGTSTLSLDAPSSDPEKLRQGRIIGSRYRVESAIGRGGFSRVFRAVHQGTGQNVALKVLGGGGIEDTAGLRRFFREARASAGLRHPNTVRVFDFGQEEDGIVYLAMELLTGKTLRNLQQTRISERGAIVEHEAIEIAIAVTKSLGEAHSLGLVHRDIGPNNIFLHEVAGSEPVVKLLDFGLVKDGGLRPLTMGTEICGTISYMSPEQILGRKITPRSDVYSLGITMWWMLTGSPPFASDSHREIMHGHLERPLPSLREHARSPVSPELEKVIEKATAKNPDTRYEDVAALRYALEHCLELARERTQILELETVVPVEETHAAVPPPPQKKKTEPRRWPRIGVAAAVLSLAAFGIAQALPSPPLPPQPPPVQKISVPLVVRDPTPEELEEVEGIEPLEPIAPEVFVEVPIVAPIKKVKKKRIRERREKPPVLEENTPAESAILKERI